MICDNITTAANGHLLFAGQDTVDLAKQYGTPLYLMDEDRIREKCRIYTAAFRKHFGDKARPLYASKALSCKRIYEIMKEEDMGIDVVSSGEIYTALQAGYDLSRAYFHSNNKTDEDIRYGMDHGIGCFVADNVEEIKVIEAEAAARNIKQPVLLRLTPGIDPHTYEAIATGKVDSKFGSAIETGQAEEITAFTLKQPHVDLAGFHCHVGSQVFAEDVFERAAVIMLEFAAEMKKNTAIWPGSWTWAAATACGMWTATPSWMWTPRWARWPRPFRRPARASASRCRRFTWSRAGALWPTRA